MPRTMYPHESLEAAPWAFRSKASFRNGALLAVNLGDDADTTGAVYGHPAGAFSGEQGIPETWRVRFARRWLIETPVERIVEVSRGLGV